MAGDTIMGLKSSSSALSADAGSLVVLHVKHNTADDMAFLETLVSPEVMHEYYVRHIYEGYAHSLRAESGRFSKKHLTFPREAISKASYASCRLLTVHLISIDAAAL